MKQRNMHVSKFLQLLFICQPYLLLPYSIQAQVLPDTTYYSASQCSTWINAALSSDLDLSGGLSENEYYLFLLSLDTTPLVSNYFSNCCNYDGGGDEDWDNTQLFESEARNESSGLCCTGYPTLPWLLRLSHKTLACRCEFLGHGLHCCEGETAEMLLDGFGIASGEVRTRDQAEYMDDFCQQLGYAFRELIPSTTSLPSVSPTATDLEPAGGTNPTETNPTESVTITEIPGGTKETLGVATSVPSVSPTEPLEVEVESRSAVYQPKEDDENGGMHPGAIFAIVFAALAVIILGVWYDRKMEEKKRSKENESGEPASSNLEIGHSTLDLEFGMKYPQHVPNHADASDQSGKDLEVSAPVVVLDEQGASKAMDTEESVETSVETEISPPKDDGSSAESSAAPHDEESSVSDFDEKEEFQPHQPAGSTLAAMGVASTVASRVVTDATHDG